MSYTADLPQSLYRADQVRELDRTAIDGLGIPGLALMERAGSAAFELLQETWPQARVITVVCGTGNNGGDGFVLARHALQENMVVRVLQLGDPERIQGDARSNLERYEDSGGSVEPFTELPPDTEVLVDAIFGTGLEREVTGEWRQAIEVMNDHRAPILALDIPSGLHSDTGRVLGVAVQAAATITFIGLKQGLFTADGPDYCGAVSFSGLEVPEEVYKAEEPSATRETWESQAIAFCPRARTAHKGEHGHVLVIGGEQGFSGAAQMAGEGALRSGAGLVSVVTRPEHAALMSSTRPELMCHGVAEASGLSSLLRRATVVAIGPGLGQSDWAYELLNRVLETDLSVVLDADGLNLLAMEPAFRNNWVLTPHPGEAARLLECETAEIQEDRFKSIKALQQRYGGVVVLKGAGTLIQGDPKRPTRLCSEGNPGMASGGMGDILTGIIAGLMAQGLELEPAATAGVCLHAAAADHAAQGGERGMLATDLLPEIRPLLNLENHRC